MYCNAADSLYVKANGEIPCWCSPGEDFPMLRLGGAGPDLDIVRDVLNGREFLRMRRLLHEGRLPFPYCRGCCFLVKDTPESWRRIDSQTYEIRALSVLQIESSFLCNVDCPLYVRLPSRRSAKPPPYQLDRLLFESVVDALARHEIPVEHVWFSGRGEPLLSRDVPAMVRHARSKLDTYISCHTNGNLRFAHDLLDCGFDQMVVSLDGVTQEGYARYRRGGSLERVVRFAADFAAAKRAAGLSRPELVWKMILFEWNSADEEIARAVQWAEEIGMDAVTFVNTDTPGGVSFRNDGTRMGEIRALVRELAARASIPVILEDYCSVYGALPEVSVDLKLDPRTDPSENPVLLGRLFNYLLEDRVVHARIDLEDEHGIAPALLLDNVVTIAERSELVNSIAIDTRQLESGAYRLRVRISDVEDGRLLAEAVEDFTLGDDRRIRRGPA
ncbi:MAG: radical SAM protein [Planctomycetota bacterium]